MAKATTSDKIYLVDDDRIVCHLLRLILRKYGYDVEVYYSAEAYLQQYKETDTGVVLIDQNMPGMTGLELQQQLNAKDAKLEIIFITAMYDAVHEAAISNGAIRVFEKPFDPKELVDLLKNDVSFPALME